MADAAEEKAFAVLEHQIKEAQQARLEVLEEVSHVVREVKAMKFNPPPAVRRSIEAVYTILECKRWTNKSLRDLVGADLAKEWSSMQRALSGGAFVSSVLTFDVAMLDECPHVAEFVIRKYFPQLLELLECKLEQLNQLSPLGGEASPQRGSELIDANSDSTTPFAAAMTATKKKPWHERMASSELGHTREAHRGSVANKSYSLADLTKAGPSPGPSPIKQSKAPRGSTGGQELRLPPAAGASAETQMDSLVRETRQQAQSRVEPSSPGGRLAGRRSRSSVKLEGCPVKAMMQEKNRPFSAGGNGGSLSPKFRPVEVVADPLNLAAVKYASQACDVFVRWAIEVLREFLMTNRLQAERASSKEAPHSEGAVSRGPESMYSLPGEPVARTLKQPEEWRTQPSGLPVRRPEDVASGNELVNAASVSVQKPITQSSSTIAKTFEKQALFSSAKVTLFGRMNSPIMRGPRWGLEGGDGIIGSPPSSRSSSSRKQRRPGSSSAVSLQPASGEPLQKTSADIASLPASSELSSAARFKELMSQAEKVLSNVHPEKSSSVEPLHNNTAFSAAAAGLSKLVSADPSAKTPGKLQSSSELLSTAVSAKVSSGQQASDPAGGTAKAPVRAEQAPTQLSGLARARAMLAKPDLVLQLPASLDGPKLASSSDQVSSSAAVAADAEKAEKVERKERSTPKWALDFSDMCFIQS